MKDRDPFMPYSEVATASGELFVACSALEPRPDILAVFRRRSHRVQGLGKLEIDAFRTKGPVTRLAWSNSPQRLILALSSYPGLVAPFAQVKTALIAAQGRMENFAALFTNGDLHVLQVHLPGAEAGPRRHYVRRLGNTDLCLVPDLEPLVPKLKALASGWPDGSRGLLLPAIDCGRAEFERDFSAHERLAHLEIRAFLAVPFEELETAFDTCSAVFLRRAGDVALVVGAPHKNLDDEKEVFAAIAL